MSRALAARNRLGITTRHHRGNSEKITEARRELAEAKIHDFVERTLSQAPPLTDEQRTRLAELLKPVRKSGAA
ncbi:hypothetical protein MU0083_003399 [[Mycobacterium] kokjensenii]|uniref:PhiRv1 phage protein n=1 Tax=[Mycobacterium] kokjensenii TaxID=3064287 RepID=A0ABM9LT67_9MYCO|nr:hypothetical protein [Mycolicibacter sp. MU0083]CAJ1504289.1 hypothetical protein MU0083_003399 [Mycolicibacter sp. MU0083]